MISDRPSHHQPSFDFGDEVPAGGVPEPQRGESVSAVPEQPALDSFYHTLMEEVVERSNMEQAWQNARRNRGAPGPDGITLDEFPEWFRPRWEELRQQLLDGTYHPGPARRVSIPKPDGGERHLGIPTVLDRLLQQAILQVLTPLFDPEFSESSYGFRPKRSAHGAVKQIQQTIRDGYRHCVDMDLSKFFDRVQHDVLMSRVSRKVHDRRLLKLIGRYLRVGVMIDGVRRRSTEGTMQGGPLSPLLANILLDDFDKELESRGLRFVRYADDFLIFVRSPAAAQRVYHSVERYLTRELKLVINEQKSRVCRTDGVEFLGYQFKGFGGQIRVSPKSLRKFRQRIRELTRRNRGQSMRTRLHDLTLYLRGWVGYFALEQRKTLFYGLDKWVRRRVRACYWKHWRLPRTRVRKLRELGIRPEEAHSHGQSRKKVWRMSGSRAVQMALNTAWLRTQGLLSLEERWKQLAPVR